MTCVSCSIPEQFVNPLFEVFDGGDFALSSYRDVESPLTEMRLYFEDASRVDDARRRLRAAMGLVGVDAPLAVAAVPDEDWRFSYRRHFKTVAVGARLVIVPEWERAAYEATGDASRVAVVLDPGLAFGTGKHETTRACLEYVDELAPASGRPLSFLDMGCGSGILSIAAAKLGYRPVEGFDVDAEAVAAATENAAKNGVSVAYRRFALGRAPASPGPRSACDLVVANILGPLLIRFADEIVGYVGGRLVLSGSLDELYSDVCAAYAARGLREVSRKTRGEWTTGLFARDAIFENHTSSKGETRHAEQT